MHASQGWLHRPRWVAQRNTTLAARQAHFYIRLRRFGHKMRVCVRVRPLSESERAREQQECCRVLPNSSEQDQGIVIISKGAGAGGALLSQRAKTNDYAFDHAFGPEATQMQVYEAVAKPLVPFVLDGYNGTVFAYGATGAGKTHTMMGSDRCCDDSFGNEGDAMVLSGDQDDTSVLDSEDGEDAGTETKADQGIIARAVSDIFRGIAERQRAAREAGGSNGRATWEVSVSYLEVYNEKIYDLLRPSASVVAGGGGSSGRGGRSLAVRESRNGEVRVVGLAEVPARSAGAVLALLRRGNANRKTEATQANQVSSRSHAVLQVTAARSHTDAAGTLVRAAGKLSLIDLAGSERASATQNSGARLREGAKINQSLLALANCINALASNSTSHSTTGRGAGGGGRGGGRFGVGDGGGGRHGGDAGGLDPNGSDGATVVAGTKRKSMLSLRAATSVAANVSALTSSMRKKVRGTSRSDLRGVAIAAAAANADANCSNGYNGNSSCTPVRGGGGAAAATTPGSAFGGGGGGGMTTPGVGRLHQTRTPGRNAATTGKKLGRRGRLGRAGKVKVKVQFRDSKLTHLLKGPLSGTGLVVMVANVNPCHTFYEDSHNTLKYANRAKNIRVDPRQNASRVAGDDSAAARADRLQRENERLHAEVRMLRERLAGGGAGAGSGAQQSTQPLPPPAPPAPFDLLHAASREKADLEGRRQGDAGGGGGGGSGSGSGMGANPMQVRLLEAQVEAQEQAAAEMAAQMGAHAAELDAAREEARAAREGAAAAAREGAELRARERAETAAERERLVAHVCALERRVAELDSGGGAGDTFTGAASLDTPPISPATSGHESGCENEHELELEHEHERGSDGSTISMSTPPASPPEPAQPESGSAPAPSPSQTAPTLELERDVGSDFDDGVEYTAGAGAGARTTTNRAGRRKTLHPAESHHHAHHERVTPLRKTSAAAATKGMSVSVSVSGLVNSVKRMRTPGRTPTRRASTRTSTRAQSQAQQAQQSPAPSASQPTPTRVLLAEAQAEALELRQALAEVQQRTRNRTRNSSSSITSSSDRKMVSPARPTLTVDPAMTGALPATTNSKQAITTAGQQKKTRKRRSLIPQPRTHSETVTSATPRRGSSSRGRDSNFRAQAEAVRVQPRPATTTAASPRLTRSRRRSMDAATDATTAANDDSSSRRRSGRSARPRRSMIPVPSAVKRPRSARAHRDVHTRRSSTGSMSATVRSMAEITNTMDAEELPDVADDATF